MNKGTKANVETELKEKHKVKPENEEAETESEKEPVSEKKAASVEKPEEEEELQTRYLRLAADFQNFKRRTEKEKNDIYAYANEKIATDLLDVIDSFDRALAADAADSNLLEGMKMILKQLKGVLEKNGIEEMKAEGEAFDPNFHHAVLVEASEDRESGEITSVLQKGYLLNKKVIRPAMVKVAE